MTKIKKFGDLEIWQLARTLNIKLIPYLTVLEQTRNFELKRQLDDVAGSIMDNIAEGFKREGNCEFIQVLAIAKGSRGESRSQLFRLLDRKLIEIQEYLLRFISELRLIEHRTSSIEPEINNPK